MNIRDLVNEVDVEPRRALPRTGRVSNTNKTKWTMEKYESLKKSLFLITVNTNQQTDAAPPEQMLEAMHDGIELMLEGNRGGAQFGLVIPEDVADARRRLFRVRGQYETKANQVDIGYVHPDINGRTANGQKILQEIKVVDTVVEVGKKFHRVHGHFILEIKHRSKISLNRDYVEQCFTTAVFNKGLMTAGKPYVSVRSIPDSLENLKNYLK